MTGLVWNRERMRRDAVARWEENKISAAWCNEGLTIATNCCLNDYSRSFNYDACLSYLLYLNILFTLFAGATANSSMSPVLTALIATAAALVIVVCLVLVVLYQRSHTRGSTSKQAVVLVSEVIDDTRPANLSLPLHALSPLNEVRISDDTDPDVIPNKYGESFGVLFWKSIAAEGKSIICFKWFVPGVIASVMDRPLEEHSGT